MLFDAVRTAEQDPTTRTGFASTKSTFCDVGVITAVATRKEEYMVKIVFAFDFPSFFFFRERLLAAQGVFVLAAVITRISNLRTVGRRPMEWSCQVRALQETTAVQRCISRCSCI